LIAHGGSWVEGKFTDRPARGRALIADIFYHISIANTRMTINVPKVPSGLAGHATATDWWKTNYSLRGSERMGAGAGPDRLAA
jgi:hypothetical protein